MMRVGRIGFFLLLVGRAVPEDYSPDDLCRAIGETNVTALQPRDRLYFEKNCVCFGDLGCAAKGGRLAEALRQQLLRAHEEAKRAAEQREAERRVAAQRRREKKAGANAATAALRRAFKKCQADPARMECKAELSALQDACDATRMYRDLQQCVEGL